MVKDVSGRNALEIFSVDAKQQKIILESQRSELGAFKRNQSYLLRNVFIHRLFQTFHLVQVLYDDGETTSFMNTRIAACVHNFHHLCVDQGFSNLLRWATSYRSNPSMTRHLCSGPLPGFNVLARQNTILGEKDFCFCWGALFILKHREVQHVAGEQASRLNELLREDGSSLPVSANAVTWVKFPVTT